jgi:prevent-host-death family protein
VSIDLHPTRGVLAEQRVRTIGARMLRHRTADVVRTVTAGERLIVTRHGEPQAVVLSLDDALELLVEPELAALAAEAERDFREGRVEAVDPPGPYPVLLSTDAADAYGRMNRQDQSALRVALVRRRADEGRLLWLRSRRWLVSFSYPDAETVLVNAVFERKELERELIGDEIWLARARRDLERMRHARDLARLPG